MKNVKSMRYANNNLRLGSIGSAALCVGLCAGIVLTGWSCRRNEGMPTPRENMALDVAPSFASLESGSKGASYSRAALESFAAGDKVGLCLLYYNGATPTPLSSVADEWFNLRYTANASGILTRIAPDKPVYYDQNETNNVDLYAYYPYNASLAKANLLAYEFSVQTNQNTLGAMAASDLCWAKNEKDLPDPITPSAAPVEMHFKHRFSKLTLAIKVPKILSGNRAVTGLSNAKLHNIVPTVLLNMATGAVSWSSDPNKKVPTTVVPLNGTQKVDKDPWFEWQFEAIIPAQAIDLNSALVGFTVETSGGSVDMVLYAPNNLFGTHGLTCQMGTQYDLSLTVGSSSGGGGGGSGDGKIEVKLDGSVIEPWKTATPVVGDLTNSITTVFSYTNAAITSAVSRVQVTTNESATVYDIVAGVTVTGTTCSFAFTRASSSPRDYGFSITKLVFLNGSGGIVYTWTGTSARVYNPTAMTL